MQEIQRFCSHNYKYVDTEFLWTKLKQVMVTPILRWLLQQQKKCSQSFLPVVLPPYSLSEKTPLTQANSRDGTNVEPPLCGTLGCCSVFTSCPTGLVVLFTFSSCSSTIFVASSCFTVEWTCGVRAAGSDVAGGTLTLGTRTVEAAEAAVVAVVVLAALLVVVAGSVVATGWTGDSAVAGGGTSPLSSLATSAGWDVSS